MKSLLSPSPRHGRRTLLKAGFSLVEITLSLGLVSFVLVALLGLFGVGLTSSRDSAKETALAQIANQVLARAYGSDLPKPDEAPKSFYFSSNAAESSKAEALYTAELTSRYPDPQTEITDVSDRLLFLSIKITWPAGSTIIHASRAAPL